ncbi:hypothetical protein FEM48_Zijuj02G0144600 [Ziziphus jujuba var. spinosa]|uniref:Uncharacterized protein n=1 Tax=Ziziphus jujuba var. spinosa TaxID=714518 RepID=A0A978VW78_ZIZJJ|nr:hypothetical protein FEM48_Zijuj02G0144600 [Ziziphus jujuba var. spinosa]
MELSEEWKSLFPISAVFRPPFLLSGPSAKPILGPLFFNPVTNTITPIFSSPSLLPQFSPLPRLSLPRFLLTSSSHSSPLPSTSSSIASLFGNQYHRNGTSTFSHNRLEILHCHGTNSFILFFPAGENSDQVGFMLLTMKGSTLDVRVDNDGDFFTAKCEFSYRISRISVNPVADSDCQSRTGANSSFTVGYLLACTMYSVHWFVVKFRMNDLDEELPSLAVMGSKVFKTCPVVHACWSPHIPEESVVLLESGALFLFDFDSSSKAENFNAYSKGTRLKVSWDGYGNMEKVKWLGCEFSWHPRILIVARTDAVFLVDLRFDECIVSCLAKIEMLHMYTSIENERFLAFTKVEYDGFHFVLASTSLLLLCDVRKPLMPLLQWTHGLVEPCYINVFRLSDLRSRPKDDLYNWASESGFCIILGSFWNCEFSLFCYGPSFPASSGSVAAEVAEFCKSFYAWELPSDLLLSGRECRCGTCLVKEEFSKDALPEWVDWQQKKDIVLGFAIINNDLSALLSEPDEFGGFTLIRLLSSGKLESQRFSASWDPLKRLEDFHGDLSKFENSLFYSICNEKYKFRRIFQYIELDYLYGYLNGNLDEVLISKMRSHHLGPELKDSFSPEFHQILCEKLNSCGFGRLRSSPAITLVFNDISLPSSIHDIALRRLWADLPMEFLQLAFSNYSEFLEVLANRNRVSLEFLAVPDLAQLPPFFLRKPSCRSNKWSEKVKHSEALVGPVLPLPMLLTLHDLRNGCPNSEEDSSKFAVEAELRLQCNEVMQVAREIAAQGAASELDDDGAVSLADDIEDTWVGSQQAKRFLLHHPTAFNSTSMDRTEGKSVYKDDAFNTLISKLHKRTSSDNEESVGLEMFDDLCPILLRFDGASDPKFESKELKAYKLLKKQFSKWQGNFDLYRDFCSKSKLQA